MNDIRCFGVKDVVCDDDRDRKASGIQERDMTNWDGNILV